jgi:hypothetical protein
MSELIEPPTGESETEKILHVATHSLEPRKTTNKKIVLFNGGIYVLLGNESLQWGYDYYSYKFAPSDEYDILKYTHTSFALIHHKKELDLRISNLKEVHEEHYEYYMKTHLDLTGKPEAEINALHLKIIEEGLKKSHLNIPSAQEIEEREKFHRNYIQEQILNTLMKISEEIYKVIKKREVAVKIKFPLITKERITQYGFKSPYAEYPCSDGVIRRDFVEYFAFLMEGIYTRHSDEVGSDWFSARLVEQVRGVFPHLNVGFIRTTDLLPHIQIHIPVEIDLPKLVH